MKGKLFAGSLLLTASSILSGGDTHAEGTVRDGDDTPARVSRITMELDLRPPFGRATLIEDLVPETGDLMMLTLKYGGRAHIIDHPALTSVPFVDPKGIRVFNTTERVNGHLENAVYFEVPYDPESPNRPNSRKGFVLIFHQDGTATIRE